MQNKNMIELIFDTSPKTPVTIKQACLLANKALDLHNMHLKIKLSNNVKVHLHDNLCDLKELKHTGKIVHSIEFELNEQSILEYHMHFNAQNFAEQLDFNDLEFNKDLKINLVGTSSFAKIRITYLGCKQQKFDIYTEQNHFNSDTSSCLCVKSVMLENANFNCKNKIFVQKNLNNVFARQINKNLLLGTKSSVSASPQLEVLSENVKCKHGTAVKTLSEDQLFYLISRGISKQQSKNLLVNGFLI